MAKKSRLADIDYARIAPLPVEEQRVGLRKVSSFIPSLTYDPVRKSYPDIFNEQGDLLSLEPARLKRVLGEVEKSCTGDQRNNRELAIRNNLEVAECLWSFVHENDIESRKYDLPRKIISPGRPMLKYWLDWVLIHRGIPHIVFIQPRLNAGLSPLSRNFVFSMMHYHVRTLNPVLQLAKLIIIEFERVEKSGRKIVVYNPSDVDIYGSTGFYNGDEIDEMLKITDRLWVEVCEEKQQVNRGPSGGAPGTLPF